MKKVLFAIGVILIAAPAFARGGSSGYSSHSSFGRSYSHSSGLGLTGDHYVSGHSTRSGGYVAGHMATNPNWTRNDNYSTRGNTNPYNGTDGTKPRDGERY